MKMFNILLLFLFVSCTNSIEINKEYNSPDYKKAFVLTKKNLSELKKSKQEFVYISVPESFENLKKINFQNFNHIKHLFIHETIDEDLNNSYRKISSLKGSGINGLKSLISFQLYGHTKPLDSIDELLELSNIEHLAIHFDGPFDSFQKFKKLKILRIRTKNIEDAKRIVHKIKGLQIMTINRKTYYDNGHFFEL